MESPLEQYVRDAVDAVREMPHQKRQVEHKTETSYILSVLRPYVESYVTGRRPKPVRDHADKRVKAWWVSVELWYGIGSDHKRIGYSEGREFDLAGGVKRYGGVKLVGLDTVAEYVADGVLASHAPEAEFGREALTKAFRYLRSAITLGKGHATMRRTSKDQRWHLICDVFREGSFPNE